MSKTSTITLEEAARTNFDVIVVGSGAGGSAAAAALSTANLKVLIIEEGSANSEISSRDRFTLQGISRRYKNSGQSIALGSPMIAYVQGTGMGGSTEINSGLYHPIYPETIQRWNSEQDLTLNIQEIQTLNREIEKILNIKTPIQKSRPSKMLIHAAKTLNIKYLDVPRWVSRDIFGNLKRNTMSNTFLPIAFNNGAKIVLSAKVEKINHRDGKVVSLLVTDKLSKEKIELKTEQVFLAAGAVSSPSIIKKSKMGVRVSKNLSLHVMLKVAALYDKEVNMEDDLGSVQILHQAPEVTYGFASSAPAVLGAAFSRTKIKLPEMIKRYPSTLLYYASISTATKGSILPNEILYYNLTKKDKDKLQQAGNELLEIIRKTNPIDILIISKGATPVKSLTQSFNSVKVKDLDLSAVHIMSSLPISNLSKSPLDEYGNLKKVKGVTIVDASALPSSPGYNPQGSVLAISLRNTRAYLRSKNINHPENLLGYANKTGNTSEKIKKIINKTKVKKVTKSNSPKSINNQAKEKNGANND